MHFGAPTAAKNGVAGGQQEQEEGGQEKGEGEKTQREERRGEEEEEEALPQQKVGLCLEWRQREPRLPSSQFQFLLSKRKKSKESLSGSR